MGHTTRQYGWLRSAGCDFVAVSCLENRVIHMLQHAIATLGETVRPHLGLSKDRVETLGMIVVGMVSARTVNVSHLATERPGKVQLSSTYRRLQRFFQHVRLEQDRAAPIVENLCGLKQSNEWYLVSSVGFFCGRGVRPIHRGSMAKPTTIPGRWIHSMLSRGSITTPCSGPLHGGNGSHEILSAAIGLSTPS